jgi:hypothetical protein
MNQMMKHLALVAGLILALTWGLAHAQQNVGLPNDLKVVDPSASVPSELRSLSGKWYGIWDETLEHVLAVEEINAADDIIFVYGYGTAPSWKILKAGWGRFKGKFESGALKGVLRNKAVVTYRLQPDGTLRATYEREGQVIRATLKKISGGS